MSDPFGECSNDSKIDREIEERAAIRAEYEATIVERDEQIAALTAEVERLQVQLAGCLTAAEGYNANPAKQGDYGWSLAYEKVLWLRELAERHIDIAAIIEGEAQDE